MTLRYLLDTNICIYIAQENPTTVLEKFEQLVVGEAAMSLITYGELMYGAQKNKFKKKTREILERLSSLIMPLPLPVSAGDHYGEVRNNLEKKGGTIGNHDLWIASHALSLGITLVTNNAKEFSRVPKLQVENWC